MFQARTEEVVSSQASERCAVQGGDATPGFRELRELGGVNLGLRVCLLQDVTEGDTQLQAEMEGARWFHTGAERAGRLSAGMEGVRVLQEGNELLFGGRELSFVRLGQREAGCSRLKVKVARWIQVLGWNGRIPVAPGWNGASSADPD